jgi:hypothetical protein
VAVAPGTAKRGFDRAMAVPYGFRLAAVKFVAGKAAQAGGKSSLSIHAKRRDARKP